MTHRHYLLVDDNLEFLDNVAEILVDHGARVTLAQSGRSALEHVKTTRFDAIVTDMRMPEMTGDQFVHALRTLDNDVPVVLLTAFSNDQQLQAAQRDGLLTVLSKHQHVTNLISVLDAARRGTVMLVEDDSALRDNLVEVLTRRGLTVVALSKVRDVDAAGVVPFVALVDLHVPGGVPGAALERVANRFPAAQAIVITAFVEESPTSLECFAKPFDTARLVARIESLQSRVERP
jgi:two-component system, response regulator PdtaR